MISQMISGGRSTREEFIAMGKTDSRPFVLRSLLDFHQAFIFEAHWNERGVS